MAGEMIEQGRGGLATSGGVGVARAPSPLRSHFNFDTITVL